MILLIIKILDKFSPSLSWPVRVFKYLTPLSGTIQSPSCWQQKTREWRATYGDFCQDRLCSQTMMANVKVLTNKQTNRKIEVQVLNPSVWTAKQLLSWEGQCRICSIMWSKLNGAPRLERLHRERLCKRLSFISIWKRQMGFPVRGSC